MHPKDHSLSSKIVKNVVEKINIFIALLAFKLYLHICIFPVIFLNLKLVIILLQYKHTFNIFVKYEYFPVLKVSNLT